MYMYVVTAAPKKFIIVVFAEHSYMYLCFYRPSEDSVTEEDYLFGVDELAKRTKKKRWISIYVMFFVIFLSAVSKSMHGSMVDIVELYMHVLLFSYLTLMQLSL